MRAGIIIGGEPARFQVAEREIKKEKRPSVSAPALSRRMRALRAPICYAAAVLAGDWQHALASCRRWCSSNKCRPRWRFISPAAGVSISVALNGLGMWGQPNHSSLCLYLLRRKPGRIFDYFICLCSTVRLWSIFFCGHAYG